MKSPVTLLAQHVVTAQGGGQGPPLMVEKKKIQTGSVFALGNLQQPECQIQPPTCFSSAHQLRKVLSF